MGCVRRGSRRKRVARVARMVAYFAGHLAAAAGSGTPGTGGSPAVSDFFVHTLQPMAPKLELEPASGRGGAHTGALGRACSVGFEKPLLVAWDPLDILTVEAGKGKIEATQFVIADAATNETLATYLLDAIYMPLETLDRTRECFRMNGVSNEKGLLTPVAFCVPSTVARDEWMTQLTHAVYCMNSGAPAPETTEAPLDKGETIQLPSESTKEQRWAALRKAAAAAQQTAELADLEASLDPDASAKAGHTIEVEIADILHGRPKVSVNGEAVQLVE